MIDSILHIIFFLFYKMLVRPAMAMMLVAMMSLMTREMVMMLVATMSLMTREMVMRAMTPTRMTRARTRACRSS